MPAVDSSIKEFSNFGILKYFCNESDFFFHSAIPFCSYYSLSLLPLPCSFHILHKELCPSSPAQLSVSSWQAVLLPSHPLAPSVPAGGSLPLSRQQRGAAAKAMECNPEDQLQGSIQLQAECYWFQMWFCCCCCCFPYFNTWNVQFCLHLWKEQPKRPTIVDYFNHTPLVLCEHGLATSTYRPKTLPATIYLLSDSRVKR